MPIPRYAVILLTLLILAVCSLLLKERSLSTVPASIDSADAGYTVVIDAGHGGFDCGKVGVDGTLEKDINLDIALKLQQLLTSADIRVLMTRTEDTAIGVTSPDNKKRQDMLARMNLINEAGAHCVVSIHQNSYPDESVDGAQVFYLTGSAEGKLLAETLQQNLISHVDPSNHRTAKANDSYYLLKHSGAPIVIAECGFLSSPEENKKLADDTYRQKLAWAIHLGILQFLNTGLPAADTSALQWQPIAHIFNSHILK